MIVLNLELDNLFGFEDFKINFSYPKKVENSSIKDEFLKDRPNFRYKKVNILLGANSTGKTSIGKAMMAVFNFLNKKEIITVTQYIRDIEKTMRFSMDFILDGKNDLYRVDFKYKKENESEKIDIDLYKADILKNDSYETTIRKIEKVNLKIDGNDISTLPNSTVPASCITNQLGINNFEASTNYIYKTTPVVVYNTETINNKEYYVPVTKRIETNENDIDTKVSIMLNEMDYDKPLSLVDQCSLQDGTLSIHLAANILNDNESIDNTLYNRIVKSASHLENVKKVSLFVDNQEIDPVQDVNGEVDNRIKM